MRRIEKIMLNVSKPHRQSSDANDASFMNMSTASTSSSNGPGYMEVDISRLKHGEIENDKNVYLSEYEDDSDKDPDFIMEDETDESFEGYDGFCKKKQARSIKKKHANNLENYITHGVANEITVENNTNGIANKNATEKYCIKSIENEGAIENSNKNDVVNRNLDDDAEYCLNGIEVDVDYQNLQVNSGEKSKKHFCVYCNKLQSKFARHLELKHYNEEKVAEFLLLPKKDPTRLTLITILRKKGDFLYNSKASYNQGNVIVVRRPRSGKEPLTSNFKPCGHCGSMYSSQSLRIHYKKCMPGTTRGQEDVFSSSRLRSYVNPNANFIMKNKILPRMRDDHINQLVRTQGTIVLFGNRLTYKYRSTHLYKMIRARLRCVARFFWHIKQINPEIRNFENVFDPSLYDQVISAINDMARLNEETGKYEAPSTAFMIASFLKKISLLLIAEMIKMKNNLRTEEIRNFLQLLQENLTYDVYKTVTENQLEQRRLKEIQLPSSTDILSLRNYLDKNIIFYYDRLSKQFCFHDWKELSSLVLVSLLVFNRRRAGEIARVKVEDFLKYKTNSSNANIHKEHLKYVRFLIRGKKARGVPVMVHSDKLKALKMILKYRKEAKVPEANPYLFGIPGQDNYAYLEADRLLRKYSLHCGAKEPGTLTGTQLRKHLATNCADWNLKDTQVKDIADYMGHHEKIHLDHYRLPSATRDITRISSILEKAQGQDSDKESFNNQSHSESINNESFSNSMNSLSTFESSMMQGNEHSNVPKKKLSWSSEEKEIVEREAGFYLANFEAIPLSLCEEMIGTHTKLRRRSATSLKAFIGNEINRRKNCILSPDKVLKKGNRTYWTPEEKQIVEETFKNYIDTKKLPSLVLCKKLLKEKRSMRNRTPEMVKAYINNLNKKKLS